MSHHWYIIEDKDFGVFQTVQMLRAGLALELGYKKGNNRMANECF